MTREAAQQVGTATVLLAMFNAQINEYEAYEAMAPAAREAKYFTVAEREHIADIKRRIDGLYKGRETQQQRIRDLGGEVPQQ